MKIKTYRVPITMIEHGFVEVEAKNETKAQELAEEECNNGGFIGTSVECEVGDDVIEN